jgi:L-fuculose-phosphate aldolase
MMRKADARVIEQLTAACHVLYVQGHNDVNHGQISARLAGEDRYWIRGAALGFDEVGPEDFAQVALAGDVIQGSAPVPPEWPIHAEIYAARPDVNAIVHTHAPATVVFGALGDELLPLSHDACPFYRRLGTFSRTTNTITSRDVARMMVNDLGANPAVLLKNHGVVVVGESIKAATILAVMLEKACTMQLKVPTGRTASASPASDVAEKNAFIFSDLSVATYWSYYLRKVERVREGHQLSEGSQNS